VEPTVAVVGASVGGVRTAQALRAGGHRGRIVLIGAEAEHPYDKPPLSKQFLAGTWGVERIELLSPADRGALGIELRLGVAAADLDVAHRRVVLADGEVVPYDVVVIATGASARRPPWQADAGVHVLRTLSDASRLRDALAGGGAVVMVGGGFIGCEVAATARAAGCRVTVVDPLAAPAGRLLGPQVGGLLADVHRRHGVDARLGVGVADIRGRPGDLVVELSDGSVLEAATVVVGIGATPNVDWLEGSGLLLGDGVVCDRFSRALSRTDDVYAVGDVARWWHERHGETVRVEHWTNATEQAVNVARNIVNPDEPEAYVPTEYVWSDQYDWKLQVAGRPGTCSELELIGDPDGDPPRFAALYRDASGVLGGAATVNWPKALLTARRCIAQDFSFNDAVAQLGLTGRPAGS
jgi:phthalate 3,4-dioxygenase ferredoxin reductase subunit